jgi:hypothetical protein
MLSGPRVWLHGGVPVLHAQEPGFPPKKSVRNARVQHTEGCPAGLGRRCIHKSESVHRYPVPRDLQEPQAQILHRFRIILDLIRPQSAMLPPSWYPGADADPEVSGRPLGLRGAPQSRGTMQCLTRGQRWRAPETTVGVQHRGSPRGSSW